MFARITNRLLDTLRNLMPDFEDSVYVLSLAVLVALTLYLLLLRLG